MRRLCSCCGQRRTDTVVTAMVRRSGAVYRDERAGLGSRSRTLCEPCALHAFALIRAVLDNLEANPPPGGYPAASPRGTVGL